MKFMLALAILAAALLAAAQEPTVTSEVPLLHLIGPIGPASADFIARSLKKAAQHQAPLVILQLDTPGGLDSSTRQIVKDILASPVPVAAWVAPGGARAASAGAYIVYASHVAAMAPGTNLGAATPVQIGGLPGTPAPNAPDRKASEPKDPTEVARPGADAMTRKVVNDSAAYLRSLAQMRGRNVDWADRAVHDGVSLSAQEAQSQRVIDFIAPDLAALLQQAHGRTVQMSGGVRHTVDSRDRHAAAVEPDWRTRLLASITDPSVAYLLLLLGIYGLYIELASPGVVLPGVAGSIALLLGLFALQMLPLNYAGVALIVLGFAMLVAEAWLPSFGALGIGGTIAFVIGSIMLIDTDTPGFGISRGLIAAVAVINALFVLVVVRFVLKARKRPVVSGSEELPGMTGEILDATSHGSWMRLRGERWRVQSDAPLHRGQRVCVTGRKGLVLRVEPMETVPADATPAGGSSGVSVP